MSITADSDIDDNVTLQDGQTASGLKAKVEAKSTGENAVHTISQANINYTPGNIQCIDNTFLYKDMNASVGGVARGTSISSSYVTLYNESGAGRLIGWLLTLELITSDTWTVKFEVDTVTVFELSLVDVTDTDFYNIHVGPSNCLTTMLGLNINENTLFWQSPVNIPMCFASSVKISAKKSGQSRDFEAGLILINGV